MTTTTPKSALLAVLMLAAAALSTTQALAVPSTLNVQGELRDGSDAALDGTFEIRFRLYDAPGGTVVWEETLTDVVAVNGLFDAVLGADVANPLSATDFRLYPQLHMALKLEAGPGITAGGEAELPARPLTSVAYALAAQDADTIDGFHASSTPNPGALLALDANGTIPAAAFSLTELQTVLVGYDMDASDDLTTSTTFGGDVSGTYDNLQVTVDAADIGFDDSSSGLGVTTVQQALAILSGQPGFDEAIAMFPLNHSASAPVPASGDIGELGTWRPIGNKTRILKQSDASHLILTLSSNIRVGNNCAASAQALVEVRMNGGMAAPRCYTGVYRSVSSVGNINHLTPHQVVCVVENAKKGLHEFDVWMRGDTCGSVYYNWNSGQNLLLVEEVDPASVTYTREGSTVSNSYNADWSQVTGRTVTHSKASPTSLIRLTLSDTFRGNYPTNACPGFWEIRVDGAAAPEACSWAKYANTAGSGGNDHHTPGVIQCMFETLGTGSHEYTLWQRSNTTACDTYTGWNRSYPLLMVEELDENDASMSYSRTGGTTGEFTNSGWSQVGGRTVTHTVTADNKPLKITLSDTLRGSHTCSGGSVRVQVYVDGAPMAQPCQVADYRAVGNGASQDYHWPFHLVCYNDSLAAGDHEFTVWWQTENCGTAYMGWNRSQNLLMIEELD